MKAIVSFLQAPVAGPRSPSSESPVHLTRLHDHPHVPARGATSTFFFWSLLIPYSAHL